MPLPKEELLNALGELRKNEKKRKFKQSVELIVKLREVDLKKPENRLSETIELPNPLDRPVRICVLATGDLALRARGAGADTILGRDELDRLGKDKKAARKLAANHDFFIAEAPLMPLVGKTIGAVLGPRAKMPTPVPPNAPIDQIIGNHRRMVRVRMRDQPVVQCRVGTDAMPDDKIAENIQTIFSRLESKLERGIKNVAEVHVKNTMGPAVRVLSSKG